MAIMKIIGDTAISDDGFQFYLFLETKMEISRLVDELNILKETINTLEKWKSESWYTEKTTCYACGNIKGYDRSYKFTLTESKSLYNERKLQYDIMIKCCEKAIQHCRDNKSFKVFEEDSDRLTILVDDNIE